MFPMVITTHEQFQLLVNLNTKLVCIPFFTNSNVHPSQTEISVLFLFDDHGNPHIAGFSHPDVPVLLQTEIFNSINKNCSIYVPDKKAFLYHVNKPYVIKDLSVAEIYYTGNNIEFDVPDRPELLPILMLLGLATKQFEYYNKFIRNYADISITDSVIIPALYWIEKNGLKVDREIFLKNFPNKEKLLTKDNFIYSQYHVNTLTGRPSNSYGKVIFSALNKQDGSRKSFVSRYSNGSLILMDFESFHLRLIANLIGFPQPSEPFHEYLGKQYLGVPHLTQEQYDEGKQRTFTYLYGEGRLESPNEFFEGVYNWIDQYWERTNSTGEIITALDKCIELNSIDSPSKSKLFNYYLQSYETIISLENIIRSASVLEQVGAVPILYTYDSILIDWNCDSGSMNDIKTIKKLIERDGQYPVRVFSGSNYHDMEEITKDIL